MGDAALPQIQVGQEYHPELNGILQQGGKSRIHSRFSCSFGKQLQFHVVQRISLIYYLLEIRIILFVIGSGGRETAGAAVF